MNTGYEMFLLVCEEMSFSGAARRAFVTQQCLSDHIRRLEERVGVRLFERRPRLQLTPAGQMLRASLLQMQALEEELNTRLGQYNAGLRGEVRLGINSGRASVLLPRVFPAFHARFPHVKLFVVNRETREMEKMLREGELDLFLGLNTRLEESFHVQPLGLEKLYLMLPAALLEQRFGGSWPDRLEALSGGADLRDFQDIPFVERGEPSTTADLIRQHCLRTGVSISNMLNINDFSNQLELCALFPAAGITPRMILPRVSAHNLNCPPECRLYVFPIRGLETSLRVDLIRRSGVSCPAFLAALEEMLAREVSHLNGQEPRLPLP